VAALVEGKPEAAFGVRFLHHSFSQSAKNVRLADAYCEHVGAV
jgi:hypothetical protein